MLESHNDETPQGNPPQRGRRLVANLAWLLTGGVLALVMVADPLDIHPLDTWMHEALSHEQRAAAERAVPVSSSAQPAAGGSAAKQLWTCSMHPQVIEDEPGTCPICGMNLVPMRTGGASSSTGEREVLFYRNPMDPTITSPVPAKDEMGMDYVPVYADEVDDVATAGPTVSIDPAIVQNMNVQWTPVVRGELRREIRTVGYLDYDQQKMVTVTTKYPGWVEKVYVNYVGEPVKAGAPLFEVYSPELVQTQQELLSAVDYARRMEDATPEAKRRADALVVAVRARLSYWDITDAQIRRLEETRQVFRTLQVTAPAGGVVMRRMPGLEGMAAKPGMELFHIADLSSLWLSVEAFEDQIGWLRVGSEAGIHLSYFPGETFRGRVRYIEPQVNEKTRTIPLKLEVPNPDGRLRAGMYATVEFRPTAARDALLVPNLAVLRTGERNLVIVRTGPGRFAPREVVLGSQGDRMVEVLSGITEGEDVVTSAQFLIDSESNLREAIQKLIAGRGDAVGTAHQH